MIGRDRHLVEELEGRVSREDQDRAFLVRLREAVPADLAAAYQSGHVCSSSQTSNSPRRTGLRRYPSRWRCSSASRRSRSSASRSARLVKAERESPRRAAARSTCVTRPAIERHLHGFHAPHLMWSHIAILVHIHGPCQYRPAARRGGVRRIVLRSRGSRKRSGDRRQPVVRLTTDPATDHGPVWSHDGSRLVLDSDRGGGATSQEPITVVLNWPSVLRR